MPYKYPQGTLSMKNMTSLYYTFMIIRSYS